MVNLQIHGLLFTEAAPRRDAGIFAIKDYRVCILLFFISNFETHLKMNKYTYKNTHPHEYHPKKLVIRRDYTQGILKYRHS
jgi:hypothetical protein